MKYSSEVPFEFSVLLVTYQRFEQFRDAILSVLDQNYKSFECLVFNDFPPDNEKIEHLINDLQDDRFRFFPSETPKGANYWRNMGISISKGKYLAFLDDDDIWLPEKLYEHKRAHEEEIAFLVFSDYYKSWYRSQRKPILKQNGIVQENIVKAMGNGEFSISTTSSVSIKNQIQWKLFDESLESFQDWDAWLNLALKLQNPVFFKIRKPLIYFVQHSKPRTSRNSERRLVALHQLVYKYRSLDVDLAGFYGREMVNLFIMRNSDCSLISKIFHTGIFMVRNPYILKYTYTYKRLGRFFFKEHLI